MDKLRSKTTVLTRRPLLGCLWGTTLTISIGLGGCGARHGSDAAGNVPASLNNSIDAVATNDDDNENRAPAASNEAREVHHDVDPKVATAKGSNNAAHAFKKDVPLEDVPLEDVPLEDVPLEDVSSEDVPHKASAAISKEAATEVAENIDSDSTDSDSIQSDVISPGEHVINETPAVHSYAGHPIDMQGNIAIGPTAIVRHTARDVVAIFYLDTFEMEPYRPGWLYVLDGKTEQIHFLSAWDFVFSSDGRRLYFSVDVVVMNDAETEDVETDAAARRLLDTGVNAVAKFIGTSPKFVRAGMFQSGHSGHVSVCQMHILHLNSGRIQALPMVGGGMLAKYHEKIVGLPRPYYYAFPHWKERDPVAVMHFVPQQSKWRSLVDAEQRGALERLEALTGEATRMDAYNVSQEVGTVLLRTRNKKLGLVVVDDDYTVDAAIF